MKPLGLDGKVGAPAIVRTNPLLRVYDTYAAVVQNGTLEYGDRLCAQQAVLNPHWPYTWDDLLEVIATNYPADRAVLEGLIEQTTWGIRDLFLRYDLCTPELRVKIPGTVPRTILVPGSCRSVCAVVTPASLIITGEVGQIDSWADDIVVIDGARFSYMELNGRLGVCATDRTPDDTFVEIGQSMLSSAALHYSCFSSDGGAICAPAEDRRFQRLFDDVLAAAREPSSFPEHAEGFRARADALKGSMWLAMRARDDPIASGVAFSTIRRFTPRGVR